MINIEKPLKEIQWATEQMPSRVKFYLWAAQHIPSADRTCPLCGSSNTNLVKRKFVVTALYGCDDCGLRFRIPRETPAQARSLYQTEYSYGFTTDCPDDETRQQLIDTSFRGSEKDFQTYIEVLQAAGLEPGMKILDFGASWGYGSWQFAQAGYEVFTYEVSAARARYAAEKLGCRVLSTVAEAPEKVDCFFSAHVIEHLPHPTELWQAADAVLKPNGIVVVLMPNGDEQYEQVSPAHYHQLWGRVHPLLLNARSLRAMAEHAGFQGNVYSSDESGAWKYDLDAIRKALGSNLRGPELLFIARRIGEHL